MQISEVLTSWTQLNFEQLWWKKISQPICQKCLILCSKILLDVLHNMSIPVLLPWQHTGFQTSMILILGWPPLAFYFDICQWCYICMIQQTCKYVRSSLALWNVLLSLKSQEIMKSGWGDWKRVDYHGNQIFIVVGEFPVELLAYQVSVVSSANWPR